MIRDDMFEVTPLNVSLITLQLFNIEAIQLREKYRASALSLMEQLIEDWYCYTGSPGNHKPLIETVKLFIDVLQTEVKRAIAKQIQLAKFKKLRVRKSSYHSNNWCHISPLTV